MRGPLPTLAWVLLAALSLAAVSAAPVPPTQPPPATGQSHEAQDAHDSDAAASAAPLRATGAAQPDDDAQDRDEQKSPGEGAKLALTAAQQEAVGIQIGKPRQLTSAPQVEAFGLVLDPVALLTDADRVDSTRAAASAASADATRLGNLYRDGAQASLKTLQASQAQAIEANAQAQAAVMTFRQQWGPLASYGAPERRALLDLLGRGERLLLRADVPGRHIGGGFGERALVDVDGVQVGARVLGPLPRTDATSQGAGWLLQIEHAPQGLGPGARVPVRLQTQAVHGLLVPAAALIYAQQGAYVYRQQPAGAPDAFRYEAVAVKALARIGDSWLVEGLTRNDRVIVQGAGVLWSLQGISSFSAAEEDHD